MQRAVMGTAVKFECMGIAAVTSWTKAWCALRRCRWWGAAAAVLAVALAASLNACAEDHILPRVAEYLSCIDLDCNHKLETVRRLGPKAVPPLIYLLEGGPNPALPGLNGPPNLVRVCIALGRLKDARAAAPLERLLEHPDPVLRAQALIALGRIGDRAVTASAVRRLRDEDTFVREAAAGALAELASATERAALQAALDEEMSTTVRVAITKALRAIESRGRK